MVHIICSSFPKIETISADGQSFLVYSVIIWTDKRIPLHFRCCIFRGNTWIQRLWFVILFGFWRSPNFLDMLIVGSYNSMTCVSVLTHLLTIVGWRSRWINDMYQEDATASWGCVSILFCICTKFMQMLLVRTVKTFEVTLTGYSSSSLQYSHMKGQNIFCHCCVI